MIIFFSVTLDSVPTSNNNGTAKLFNIKDSSGSSRLIPVVDTCILISKPWSVVAYSYFNNLIYFFFQMYLLGDGKENDTYIFKVLTVSANNVTYTG